MTEPPITEARRISANGIDFAYLDAGPADGPLALCLHGFPDHAPTYTQSGLLDALAGAGYHAVAPWLRGYSPTGLAPDGNYEVASLALDALALADTLAPDRDAVLVGHDWGAIAAYVAVGHRPDRFSKLVTMAVPHQGALMARFLSTPEQLKRSWYIFFFQSPLADVVVPMNDFAVIDLLWRDWSPGLRPDHAFMRALKDTLGAPESTQAAIGYYRAMLGSTLPNPELAEVAAAGNGPIPVPTLYLHGADDGCIGIELVDESEIRPFFPAGIDVDVVPASGHFMHLDQPEHVNRRILEFLAK
jgi:pimeloyl-ACP methyl ester carboxylesterase